jgi:transcriptional regulator with XRE-family HTH domain
MTDQESNNRDTRVTRGGILLRQWLAKDDAPSQGELAYQLGVSQSAISNLVRGYQRPSLALSCLIQARTRTAVRVTDWLDDEEATRYEEFQRTKLV